MLRLFHLRQSAHSRLLAATCGFMLLHQSTLAQAPAVELSLANLQAGAQAPADDGQLPELPPTDVEAEVNQPDDPVPPSDTPFDPTPVPNTPGGPDFERALESAGTETIIPTERLQRNVPRSLADVFRYEPGVQVQSSNGRFGETSINIRGLEGNRVLIQVDGIRSADSFQQGPIQLGRGSIDVNLLKQVDIYRGPGSLIYGEGALGGAVIFETKDPDDFLNIFGRDIYYGISGTHYTADRSWAETPVVAFRSGNWDFMAAFSRRDGHELESNGDFPADPQNYHSNYVLAKGVYHLNPCNETEFAFERFEQNVFTQLRSTLAMPASPFNFNSFVITPESPAGLPGARLSAAADDTNTRNRYSITHDYVSGAPGLMSTARFQIYYQDTELNDDRNQLFSVPAIAPPFGTGFHLVSNPSSNFFTQDHFGGRMIFRGEWDAPLLSHSMVYGADALRTDTSRLRTGTVDNLFTGNSINTNQIGEPTPLKVLPDVTTTRVGLFFRDRMEVRNTPLSITPGVRVNYYSADFDTPDPLVDDTFGTPEDIEEWFAQPYIELGLELTRNLDSLVRYTRGYRGPPVEDAGIGFTNPLFGYTILPNPNLRSETSDSLDVGLSYSDDIFAGYVGGYYNRYNDFIANISLGFDPNLNLLVFQQQNIDAQIYGAEAAGEVRLWGCDDRPLCERGNRCRAERGQFDAVGWHGWSAFANWTYSVGDNLEDDVPLDSIPPMWAIAGIRYRAEHDLYGAEFITTMVHGKDRISGDVANQFVPPGYGVFDLLAWYNPSPHLRLNAGVFNIFDRTYFPWLNVRGVTADQADLGRFAAPGTSFAGTVEVRY